MAVIPLGALETWLRSFAALVAANREHLTALDAAVGDADHGSNLDRGMSAVVAALDASPVSDTGELFKRVSRALISNVGGASGPLFGTFFLRLGASLGAASTISGLEFGSALRAGSVGVAVRGKADRGDKTMLDALAPALDAWDETGPADVVAAARAAAAAAAEGRDATAALVAHKGRASYLGERSVGHVDPGAASTALLFAALADTLAAEL